MGCGMMSPALHLLLSLASCSLLQGKPVLNMSPQSGGPLAAGQGEAQGHLSHLLKVPGKRRGPSGHQGVMRKKTPGSAAAVSVLSLLFCQLCLCFGRSMDRVLSVCEALGGCRC